MLERIIPYSFYLLFFLTPLLWTSLNYELFEYNKMLFTYGVTVVIVGAWLIKIINRKSLIFNHTPLDIPLLLFLTANILSTIFSIDPHTSIWGYYSRSNGGLLSLVSFLLLYWAFVSNMDLSKVKNALKAGLTSGFLISLWAILEHFGVSPSCLILRGELNDSCWIQDVQARVFATLGQPNWLAAYLAMLIFPALYFLITTPTRILQTTYYILLTTLYLAFTFTYSRGPTLGLLAGLIVFLGLYFIQNTRKTQITRISVNQTTRKSGLLTHPVLGVILSFLVINLLFGSALTSFRLVSKFAAPLRPAIALPPPVAPSGTQLENGGTESGRIRFIVWKGALDIFKHNPIFGSGLETFAYSYYQYRPASHNLTSEWDFLYNKAHNEYLNYLATTGIMGFVTYMLVIGTFMIWSIKKILKPVVIARNVVTKQSNQEIATLPSVARNDVLLLIICLLASYVSYLIYNFFLFSVVIIAIFFYLFPALVFVATSSTKAVKLPSIFHFPFSIINLIYRRPLYTKIAKGIIILSTIYLLFSIFQLWYADTLFAKGETASEAGSAGQAYNLLTLASELNKREPFYRSELGFAGAQAGASLKETDATLSGQLKDEAVAQTEEVLRTNPKNVSYLRTAVRTYFELATIDKSYIDKTLQTLDEAIKLAPTDPKLYYNKALVLDTVGRKDEEVKVLRQVIQLKPNYLEALAQLKQATESAK